LNKDCVRFYGLTNIYIAGIKEISRAVERQAIPPEMGNGNTPTIPILFCSTLAGVAENIFYLPIRGRLWHTKPDDIAIYQ
jgi:hypothetical protein